MCARPRAGTWTTASSRRVPRRWRRRCSPTATSKPSPSCWSSRSTTTGRPTRTRWVKGPYPDQVGEGPLRVTGPAPSGHATCHVTNHATCHVTVAMVQPREAPAGYMSGVVASCCGTTMERLPLATCLVLRQLLWYNHGEAPAGYMSGVVPSYCGTTTERLPLVTCLVLSPVVVVQPRRGSRWLHVWCCPQLLWYNHGEAPAGYMSGVVASCCGTTAERLPLATCLLLSPVAMVQPRRGSRWLHVWCCPQLLWYNHGEAPAGYMSGERFKTMMNLRVLESYVHPGEGVGLLAAQVREGQRGPNRTSDGPNRTSVRAWGSEQGLRVKIVGQTETSDRTLEFN